MVLSDYLPNHNSLLDEWADNYLTQMALLEAALGVVAGEMANVTAKIGTYKTRQNSLLPRPLHHHPR